MRETLYSIDVGYACFGAIFIDDTCVHVAPIGSWMRGRPLADIRRWVQSKGGTCELVSERAVAFTSAQQLTFGPVG